MASAACTTNGGEIVGWVASCDSDVPPCRHQSQRASSMVLTGRVKTRRVFFPVSAVVSHSLGPACGGENANHRVPWNRLQDCTPMKGRSAQQGCVRKRSVCVFCRRLDDCASLAVCVSFAAGGACRDTGGEAQAVSEGRAFQGGDQSAPWSPQQEKSAVATKFSSWSGRQAEGGFGSGK